MKKVISKSSLDSLKWNSIVMIPTKEINDYINNIRDTIER